MHRSRLLSSSNARSLFAAGLPEQTGSGWGGTVRYDWTLSPGIRHSTLFVPHFLQPSEHFFYLYMKKPPPNASIGTCLKSLSAAYHNPTSQNRRRAKGPWQHCCLHTSSPYQQHISCLLPAHLLTVLIPQTKSFSFYHQELSSQASQSVFLLQKNVLLPQSPITPTAPAPFTLLRIRVSILRLPGTRIHIRVTPLFIQHGSRRVHQIPVQVYHSAVRIHHAAVRIHHTGHHAWPTDPHTPSELRLARPRIPLAP